MQFLTCYKIQHRRCKRLYCKCWKPCTRKVSGHTTLDSLCTDTARILRYSTCGDHARMQEYNDSTHHACVTNYDFTYITLCKYSLTWDSSVVWLVNFFIGKILLKLKVYHLGIFVPRENNSLYSKIFSAHNSATHLLYD